MLLNSSPVPVAAGTVLILLVVCFMSSFYRSDCLSLSLSIYSLRNSCCMCVMRVSSLTFSFLAPCKIFLFLSSLSTISFFICSISATYFLFCSLIAASSSLRWVDFHCVCWFDSSIEVWSRVRAPIYFFYLSIIMSNSVTLWIVLLAFAGVSIELLPSSYINMPSSVTPKPLSWS